MNHYSKIFWLALVPTSISVGVPTYLAVDAFTNFSWMACAATASLATVTADLAVAAWMESIAPTRVTLGPGEKFLKSEPLSHKATVLSGFDGSSTGQVLVHGETWQARHEPGDRTVLAPGVKVRVVDRDGLTLIVSAQS